VLLMSCLLTPKPADAETTTRYQSLHNAVRNAGNLVPEIQQANTTDQDQMLCMALNIYHEIRGGSARDQWAVAFVTWNRTKRAVFHSKTTCAVVWAPGQFSWTRRPMRTLLPREKASWTESQHKAVLVLAGEKMNDPTNGSTHFNTSLGSWARGLVNKFRIGAHWFARLPGSN
jgi:N-acetylmuramoyl-L-alanine amidase